MQQHFFGLKNEYGFLLSEVRDGLLVFHVTNKMMQLDTNSRHLRCPSPHKSAQLFVVLCEVGG